MHTDTTDVQSITVFQDPTHRTSMILCTFIEDSDAYGCLVHINDNDNRVKMLTRNTTINRACALIESSENISEVYGYDIEYDGSVGSLRVPGIALDNESSNSSLFLNFDCKLLNDTLSPPSSYRKFV